MKAFSILVASVTLSVGLFVGDVRGDEEDAPQSDPRLKILEERFQKVLTGLQGKDDAAIIKRLATNSGVKNLTATDLEIILKLKGTKKTPMPARFSDHREYFVKVADALTDSLDLSGLKYTDVVDQIEDDFEQLISSLNPRNQDPSIARLSGFDHHAALRNGFIVVQYLIAQRNRELDDENRIKQLIKDLKELVIPALTGKAFEDPVINTSPRINRRRIASGGRYSTLPAGGNSFEQILRSSQERILRIKVMRKEYKAARRAIRDLD